MPNSVDTVLFDLDGTLVEYERPSSEVLAAAFDRAGVEPFFTVREYYDRYFEFLGSGVDDLREYCFADIAEAHDRDPAVGRTVAEAYAAERRPGSVRLLDGARAAVESLAADHSLGIVTNGPPSHQRPKIDALGFDDRFGSVVFAGHETPPKPDPEPFERALGDLDAAPTRTVHVGNSLESDVAGADAAGLQSVWLADGSEPEPTPDHVVDSLLALSSPPWR